MSSNAVDNNPLEFLKIKKDRKKRKLKTSDKDFFERADRRGFHRLFGSQSSSSRAFTGDRLRRYQLDENSGNSFLRGIDSSQSLNSTSGFYSGLSSNSISQNSIKQNADSTTLPDNQDCVEPPKPTIRIEKCREIKELMRKRDLLVFRETSLTEIGSTNVEKVTVTPISNDDIGFSVMQRQLQGIHNALYQLLRWPTFFSVYRDHHGILLQHNGKGTLETGGLRNPNNFPMFLNSAVIEIDETIDLFDYLPIKRTRLIEPADISMSPFNRDDVYIGALWDKVLRELVIVKAEKYVPAFNTTSHTGYSLRPLPVGERQWVPYNIAIALCNEGLILVELPNWLKLDYLQQVKVKEETNKETLTELPSPFFYEIAYMFGLYGCRRTSLFCGRVSYSGSRRAYIAKAKGLIEKIHQVRESKIINIMGHLLEENVNAFIIPNILLFETSTVNELLSMVWDKELDYSNEETNPRISLTVTYQDDGYDLNIYKS